jgi:hypothetical protein
MLKVELPQYVEETYAAELLAGCAGGIGYLLEGSREPGRRIPLPPSDSGHRRVLAVPAYLNP